VTRRAGQNNFIVTAESGKIPVVTCGEPGDELADNSHRDRAANLRGGLLAVFSI
jgi:hypothetical protein